MKILQLRFKNLNSLQGEWQIDFTDPNYLANGIFALTGPTGAGKSTVLDAICLALYGATPRLGKITKNNNDIMSRQTGECFAEVCFESSEGRFICHWSQHRAKKQPEGALQVAKHEIADADQDGRIIENQIRRVAAVIEEKTGMDFDRFTRSMLLAQGGFDTFLKADIEQKSRILEQITGTEIYSRISIQTHERMKEEREQLNILRSEIAGIVLLSEEQKQAIEQTLTTQLQQQNTLSGQLTQTGKAIAWLQLLESISRNIKELEKEAEQLQTEREAFIPQRQKLQQAVRASHLDGLYATITALRKQQQDDQQQLTNEQKKLPELEQNLHNSKKSSQKSEQVLSDVRTQLQSAAELFKKVRSLDQFIVEKQHLVKKLNSEYRQYQQQIEAEQAAIQSLEKESETSVQQRRQCEAYLNDHAKDQWLISGLTGIKAQLGSLAVLENEQLNLSLQIKAEQKAQLKYQQGLQEKQTATDAYTQALKVIQEQTEQKQQQLNTVLQDRFLREYRAEKEALLKELSLLKTIASLEAERKKLEDNKPCPLCGSLEHPYAMGNVPAMDETQKQLVVLDDIIARAEQLEQTLNELAQQEKTAQQKLSEAEKQMLEAEHKLSASKDNLQKLEQSRQQQEDEFKHLKTELLQQLQPLGIAEAAITDFEALLKELQNRLETWQQQQQNLNEFEQKLAEFSTRIKSHESVITTLNKTALAVRQTLNDETVRLEQLKTERQELFANKDVDVEENQLRKSLAEAEQAEKAAREQQTRIEQDLNSLQTRIQSLELSIKRTAGELNTRENQFQQQLPAQGFASETEFVQASLTVEQREELNKKAQDLDNRQISINTRLTDYKQKLQTEQNKKITQQSLDTLLPEQQKLEQQISELRNEVAALKHQLEQDLRDQEKIRQKQAAIDKQQKEYQRWEKLHTLIGSSDGKKYRNFAQGLTFELMVSHANLQLKKMSDRYLLVRDKNQPLELNVIDNYQAGEIRSVRNLSGGESFIVSLSLALGLSKMASRKVRVDSLFLDEGFGSLDEEALENALEALSGLHQDGKLIGIISHVSALKERISTQIQVAPLSGGKSAISGPGCLKVC